MDEYDNSPGWEQYEQMLEEQWYTENVLTAETTDSQKQHTTEEVKKDGTYSA